MSLFVTSLNSGSNGNCYYIGNSTEAILIDAGLCCRETEKRMKRLGLSLQTVKAIFISHEHSDHIQGVPVLANKYNLPVYITAATHRYSSLRLEKHLLRDFQSNGSIPVGELTITAFQKVHDAADPCSFVVTYNGLNVGVFTDIGTPCAEVIRNFGQCHAAFLEANYDNEMLEGGNYPCYLKNRIRGGKGHLSNEQALALFRQHKPPYMSHLFLSHLSKNNNCPNLVQSLFDSHADGIKIIVASRFKETEVYQIQHSTKVASIPDRYPVSAPQLQFSFT